MNNEIIKILVVEDNEGNVKLLNKTCKSSQSVNFDFVAVSRLSDALELLSRNMFDVILLDLNLPDSKGFDTFNKLYNNYSEGPVIVFTDLDDEELGHTIVRMGAQDFLIKGSYDESLLQKSIEYAIDRFDYKKLVQKKEKQFREIIEKNADGMIVADLNGMILYVNPVAESILKNKSELLIGTKIKFKLDENEITEEKIQDLEDNEKIIQIKVVNAVWEGSKCKIATIRDITDLKTYQNKIEHLNKLLKTISSINHLIVHEKEASQLLQKACKRLIEGNIYTTAWIGLYDRNFRIIPQAQAGLDNIFNEFKEYAESNNGIYCVNKLRENHIALSLFSSEANCAKCPLAHLYSSKGNLAVEISYEGQPLGVLVVSRPSQYKYNGEEDMLLAEVAADIGLALHTFEIKESQKREFQVQKALADLYLPIVSPDTKIESIAKIVLESALQLTESSHGFVSEIDPETKENVGHTLTEMMDKGCGVQSPCKKIAFPPNPDGTYRGLWGYALNNRVPIFTNNPSSHPSSTGIPKGHVKLYNFAAVPVISEDELLGEIALANSERDFSEKDIEVLKRLGEYYGFAIQKVRAYSKLLKSENQFRSLYENAVIGLYRTAPDGTILMTNPAHDRMMKHDTKKGKMNSLNVKDVYVDPAARKTFEDTLNRNGKISGFETAYRKGDGSIIYVRENAVAVKDDEGRILYYEGSFEDITSKVEAQKALKESEERFRGFFENATIGLYRTTPDGKILDANLELVHMLGYNSKEQMLSQHDVIENHTEKSVKHEFDRIIQMEGQIYGYEATWRKADGTPIHIQESARAVYDEHGSIKYYEGAVVDVTNQKRIQEQVAKSELQFRTIWENSFDGMRLTDKDGVILQVNEAFCQLVDMKKNELIGHLFHVAYSDKTDAAVNRYKHNFNTGDVHERLETKVILNSGEVKWISLSNSFIHIGNEKLLLSIFRDITDQKVYEIELTEAKERAEESDKLKSEFLAQMSHEIRTPLNAILSFNELLKDEVKGKVDKEVFESFAIVDSSGKRIIRTIDLILNMSQLQTGAFTPNPVSLHVCKDILQPMVEEYKLAAHEKHLQLILQDKCDSCKVLFDEYCMYQIFSNLIDNAIKFTNKGYVKISTNDEVDGLEINIEDTGIGISEDFLDDIFKPFTQEQHGYSREYDGNGLGLALVKKYCDLNNARIRVESKKGKGSKFTLTIPR